MPGRGGTSFAIWLAIAAIAFLFGSELKNTGIQFALETKNSNRITDISLHSEPKKVVRSSQLQEKKAVRVAPRVVYHKHEFKKSESDETYWEHIKRKYIHRKEPELFVEKAPDGSIWEVRRKTTLHTHEHRVRRVNQPNHCQCVQSKAPGNGWCWYYYNDDSYYCKKRRCRPKFVCVSYHTGLTCMKRKTKEKVVPITLDTCRTVRMESTIYVPYSSR